MEDNNRQTLILYTKLSCVFVSIIKKWKLILVITMMFGISFDIFKTLTYKPQYVSTATAVLLSENNSYSQLENTLGFIDTLKYILNGQVVKSHIEEQTDVKNINYNCQITSVNNTNVIRVQVYSSSKAHAYYALNYIDEWYQTNQEKYRFSYDFKITEKMAMSDQPINTNSHLLNFRNGMMISGIILIGAFACMAYLSDTIMTSYDIDRKIESRLFAKIPKEIKSKGKKFWKKTKQGLLITSLKTSFHYKEAIKKLRNRFEESAKKHKYKVVMITSSLENEGKSSIAANLAISLAQNEHKVLLIDGDIRKPSVHKLFEIKSDLSLNNYLSSDQSWQDQCIPFNKYNLDLICAYQDLEHAESYVQSEKMKQLIDEARSTYDYVIIDSSPARYLNEPSIINEYVDASLVVVKQDEASTKVINETIMRLKNAKNNVIGCIYNASIIDVIRQQKVYGYRYGYNRYTR